MPIVVKTIEELPPLDDGRIERLKKMRDKDIDVSDMPALTQEQLARFVPAKLLNRSLYRPVKIPVKMTYDADVLEWFRPIAAGVDSPISGLIWQIFLLSLLRYIRLYQCAAEFECIHVCVDSRKYRASFRGGQI